MFDLIEKPWGKEEILEINKDYMLKRLIMYKGCRCSLQYHNKKVETIYVLLGELKIQKGKTKENLEDKICLKGEFITINKLEIHRMEALSDCIYLETSTPYTDDTVRLQDDYDRD